MQRKIEDEANNLLACESDINLNNRQNLNTRGPISAFTLRYATNFDVSWTVTNSLECECECECECEVEMFWALFRHTRLMCNERKSLIAIDSFRCLSEHVDGHKRLNFGD